MEVYSINGEDNWTKDIDDIICGLNEDGQLGEVEITKGESIPATHKEFVDTDILMESIADRAYDKYGDHTDTYLDDVDSEKKEELKKVIANWLNYNTKKPDFYGVENIEKTTVFIGDKTTENQQLQVGQMAKYIKPMNKIKELYSNRYGHGDGDGSD